MSDCTRPDPVEVEYLRAIARARDNEEAYELSIGLIQYRKIYKLQDEEWDPS